MNNPSLASKIVRMASELAIYSEYNNKDENYQSKRTDMFSDFCEFVFHNVKDTLDK